MQVIYHMRTERRLVIRALSGLLYFDARTINATDPIPAIVSNAGTPVPLQLERVESSYVLYREIATKPQMLRVPEDTPPVAPVGKAG